MIKRLALPILTVALAMTLAPKTSVASDQTDVMAAVHQFMDNLNSNKPDAALSACNSPASIIDEFPPHQWSGPTACADWLRDYGTDSVKNGVTDGTVTLGAPWHVDVTGDRGYVVVPAVYDYKDHGKPAKEPHSILTVALRKTPSGWRIAGWTWSKH